MNPAGYCKICGAPLINSPDGIGCGCRAMLRKCTYLCMKKYKETYYKYWNVESNSYMTLFIKWANGKKFRSSFRKNFVPSVIDFYNSKKYISKKQFELVKNIIDLEYDNDYTHDVLVKEIKEKKEIILEDFRKEHYSEIIELTHKMWASQKNN